MTPTLEISPDIAVSFSNSALSYRPNEDVYVAIIDFEGYANDLLHKISGPWPESGQSVAVSRSLTFRDEEGVASCDSTIAFSLIGRPGDEDLIAKATMFFGAESDFERFKRFLERYAKANGLRVF
ncbi:photosystem II reaction center protein Psb28 [uncultured Rubinisphaera sp.]|uniref:photosystem II reaction center protein Psb28 n=1 Tax=uncultured Rubinisphaera sp. TaxID=1678686 RepID=UPI0030DA1C5D